MKENRIPPEALQFFREQGKRGGQIGGKKRAANMTPDQRSEAARRMVQARIAKRKAAIEAGALTPKREPIPEPASEPQRNRCVRCGYEWEPRKANSPKCPGCRCYRWDLTAAEHTELKRANRHARVAEKEPVTCEWCFGPFSTHLGLERHEEPCRTRQLKALRRAYRLSDNMFIGKLSDGELTDCHDYRDWLRLLYSENLTDLLKPAPEAELPRSRPK